MTTFGSMRAFDGYWNRCDVCGKFISIDDFSRFGPAIRLMLTPDAEGTPETWETLCAKHAEPTLSHVIAK